MQDSKHEIMIEKETLLVKGQIFGLLSRLFDYPDAEMQKDLYSGSFARQISQSLQNLPRRSELDSFVGSLSRHARGPGQEAPGLEEEYTYLFYRNVQVPPYESRYNEEQQGLAVSTLSDLASFYAAFGMRLQEKAGETADHITVELEFLSVLYLKEAYALEKGWDDKAEICRDARRRFLKEHIGRWFGSFTEALHKKARLPFYPSLADLTRGLLSLELEPAK